MKTRPFLILLPFLGGFLYALGFPSFITPHLNFFLGPILGIILLLSHFPLNLNGPQPALRDSSKALLAFSLGFGVAGFYWIPETIKIFGNIPFPFHYLLGLLFGLIIVPQYWIFLFLLHSLGVLTRRWGHRIKRRLPDSALLILYALGLTLCEQWVPQQFPAHVGHPWLFMAPYLSLAPLFGAPLFSFISFWIGLCFIHYFKTKRLPLKSLVTAVLLLLANFLGPLAEFPQKGEQNIHIRVVQANVGNYLKVVAEKGLPNSLYNVLKHFMELSTRMSEAPLDLIIWPETAYPHTLDSTALHSPGRRPKIFEEIQKFTKAEILFGGYDRRRPTLSQKSHPPMDDYEEIDYETLHNSAFFLKREGGLGGVYHKHLLIPFGETLPFGPLNRFLGRYVDNISYFARGNEFTHFTTQGNARFAVAICYELLFSDFIREILNAQEKGPHFLVNLTNDSWYGDTAEPYQHLFLAKWRAIEFQIPIIRSTNTGITSVIYPDGQEGRRIPLNSSGILDVQLPLVEREGTFYQRWGISSLLFLAGFLFLLSLVPIKNPLAKGRAGE